MSKFTNSTESKTDSTNSIPSPTGYVETKAAPAEDSNSGVDDFGYEEVETKEVPPPEPPKADEEPKVEKAATGYGKESEEDAEKNKIPKPAETEEAPPSTDEEKLKKELTDIVKDLPDSIDKDKVTKFALDNKLTKEQLQAYTNLVKEDQVAIETSQKEAIKTQRNDWKNELVKDPEFGGENFDKNVDRVEKVLEKYMPNTKKILTERGSMLPPYIMRDFLALSKVLNPTAPLVVGNPGSTEDTSKNFLDDMYE